MKNGRILIAGLVLAAAGGTGMRTAQAQASGAITNSPPKTSAPLHVSVTAVVNSPDKDGTTSGTGTSTTGSGLAH